MLRARTAVRAAVAVAAAVALLAGCSGGEGGDGAASSPSATGSPTPSPTERPAGLPAGVELTEPGTQLAFGDTATVMRRATGSGSGRAGVLEVTVESARQGALEDFVGFDLDSAYKRRGNYFYVRVRLRNAGRVPLGGGQVPLWGISGDNTLLQPVQFTSSFKKCPTEELPARFRAGAAFETCLVYLSPDRGELEGVSYRPSETDVPIEWRGAVEGAAGTGQAGQEEQGQQEQEQQEGGEAPR